MADSTVGPSFEHNRSADKKVAGLKKELASHLIVPRKLGEGFPFERKIFAWINEELSYHIITIEHFFNDTVFTTLVYI